KGIRTKASKVAGLARARRNAAHALSIAEAGRGATAPIAAERVGGPDLRLLRLVLMPGARLKISVRLVLHLIKLAIELHDLSVRIAVIDENVVSDDVAARPPDEVVLVAAEEIARALN